MKSIPAFSKKSSSGATVGGGGQRSGFTKNVVSPGKATKAKAVPHMAATYPVKSTLTRTTGATPKATKAHSGKAAKSVTPFSKKKV